MIIDTTYKLISKLYIVQLALHRNVNHRNINFQVDIIKIETYLQKRNQTTTFHYIYTAIYLTI